MSMAVGKGRLRSVEAVLRDRLHLCLKNIDIPTWVIHGDDDQIVPIDFAGRLTARMVAGVELKVYPPRPPRPVGDARRRARTRTSSPSPGATAGLRTLTALLPDTDKEFDMSHHLDAPKPLRMASSTSTTSTSSSPTTAPCWLLHVNSTITEPNVRPGFHPEARYEFKVHRQRCGVRGPDLPRLVRRPRSPDGAPGRRASTNSPAGTPAARTAPGALVVEGQDGHRRPKTGTCASGRAGSPTPSTSTCPCCSG